ncbi:hypothetical protein COO60DRAFT_1521625 [Scenedesmus sp. NREL 46B-D3]|nr:hypothetical protein COO60DRAFT_1521625 [Scenedesmus sp. NREL 46B-D3]
MDPSKIRSWRLLAVCLVLDICCFGMFKLLQDQILAAARANGYGGTAKDLLVLDLRVGYSPDEARQLFSHWGTTGAALFVVCEAVDYVLHMPCFGCVLLVLMNRLGPMAARKTGLTVLRKSYMWVLLAVALDVAENALQLVLVLAYLQRPETSLASWWEAAATAGSAVNTAKWWSARCGGAFSLLLAAAALSPGSNSLKPTRQQKPKQG